MLIRANSRSTNQRLNAFLNHHFITFHGPTGSALCLNVFYNQLQPQQEVCCSSCLLDTQVALQESCCLSKSRTLKAGVSKLQSKLKIVKVKKKMTHGGCSCHGSDAKVWFMQSHDKYVRMEQKVNKHSHRTVAISQSRWHQYPYLFYDG